MKAAAEAEFRQFVVARYHRLLRTARLLTGDHAAAEQLLHGTLARAHRNWRRVTRDEDPEVYALRALVARHASRRREWTARAGRAIRRAGDHPGTLRPRTRAVLVLRHYEGLDEQDVAAVLRWSDRAVRREETRGLELSGKTSGELPGLFQECAASVPQQHDPYERTHRAVRRDRRRRAVVTAVCACLALAVAVPMAVFTPFRDPPLEDWPVRGSLADDAAFLEAARAEAVESMELRDDWRVTYSRVVYAGERGRYRRVVVVLSTEPRERQQPGRPDAQAEHIDWLLLLHGTPGAEPDDLYPQSRVPIALPGSPAWTAPQKFPHLVAVDERPVAGDATLFALGPPDTRAIAYSPRPRFHPDGTWDRSWRDLPTRDGVAVAELSAAPGGAAVTRLRLSDGTTAGVTSWTYQPPDVSLPEVEGLPPGASGAPPEGVMSGMTVLALRTGIPASRFDVHVVWHRQGERWRSPQSWLLAATAPSGATFQVLQTDGSTRLFLVPRGSAGRPVAVSTIPLRYVAAMGADLEDTPRVIVVAPGLHDAKVQLWQSGRKLATAAIGESERALFRGQVIRRASKGEGQLRFRILDRAGEEVHRGSVRTGGGPPWMRSG